MKRLTLILASLMLATSVAAQNPTTYFMEGSTFRSQLNPAFAPLRGYLNIPALGGVQIGTSGNIALDNIFQVRDGRLVSILDSSISSADALAGLKDDNNLGLDARINILGFGAFAKNQKSFWSFDVSLRSEQNISLPRSLFEFLKCGKEGRIENVGLYSDNFVDVGFNYSFPLMKDKLYLGARVKLLVGLMRARLEYDYMNVTLDENRWSVETKGELDITHGGASPESLTYDEMGRYGFDDVDWASFKPSGFGAAIDLGATYNILPNLQASLAVTDLGFISWGKSNNSVGTSNKTLEFTGVDVDVNGTSTQPDFDLNIIEFESPESVATTRMLHATINAGVEYQFFNHKLGVGALYSARFWDTRTAHNLTISANYHPRRWVTVTGSYSLINNCGSAVGLAVNFNSAVNFFIATDILCSKLSKQWIPVKQSAMNVTFGLGIPIGKRSHRVEQYIKPSELIE